MWLTCAEVNCKLLRSLTNALRLSKTKAGIFLGENRRECGDHGVVLLLVDSSLLSRGGETTEPETAPLLPQLRHLGHRLLGALEGGPGVEGEAGGLGRPSLLFFTVTTLLHVDVANTLSLIAWS